MINLWDNRKISVTKEESMKDTTGTRLLSLQKQKEWNGKEITDYLRNYGVDIDPSHYSRLLNDKALMSVQVLKALALLLECTTDFILCMPYADDPKPFPAPDVFMTPEANKVGEIMDRMDDDMRSQMVHMAEAMLRINEERKELHAEISELLREQIEADLLSGQKRQKVESLLGRLSPL